MIGQSSGHCRRSGLPPASGDIGTGLPQALMHTYQVVVAVLPDRGCSIHLHIFRESQRLSHLACIEHTAGQVAALNVSCARVFRSIAKHTQDLYPPYLAMLIALFDRLNVLPVCTRLLKGGRSTSSSIFRDLSINLDHSLCYTITTIRDR